MTRQIIPSRPQSLDRQRELRQTSERAASTILEGVSEETRRAYTRDWGAWEAWAVEHGLEAFPARPEPLCTYLQHLADEGLAFATIQRRCAAVASRHIRQGHPSPWKHPMVKAMLRGLATKLDTQPHPKAALDDRALKRVIEALVEAADRDPLALRDKAALLLQWATALRRSELVALRVEDLEQDERGLRVLIRRSKTDQDARGRLVPVFFARNPKLCPIRSVQKWMQEGLEGATKGWLFPGRVEGTHLSAHAWVLRLKGWVEHAGLDAEKFSGHSPRRGFITTAARAGRGLDAIAATSRHKTLAVLMKYIERETIFDDGAGDGLL